MRIVLASDSPRRKELLRKAGLRFTAVSCPGEEKVFARRPVFTVRHNSEQKANLAARAYPEALIISADTVVYLDKILGKPPNRAAARKMLRSLSGKTHRVYTAVTVLFPRGRKKITRVAVTRVKMKKLSGAIIEEYLRRVNPLDKAGAYAIQECGEMIVERISGSYSNVVGLPLETLSGILRSIPEAGSFRLRNLEWEAKA